MTADIKIVLTGKMVKDLVEILNQLDPYYRLFSASMTSGPEPFLGVDIDNENHRVIISGA